MHTYRPIGFMRGWCSRLAVTDWHGQVPESVAIPGAPCRVAGLRSTRHRPGNTEGNMRAATLAWIPSQVPLGNSYKLKCAFGALPTGQASAASEQMTRRVGQRD